MENSKSKAVPSGDGAFVAKALKAGDHRPYRMLKFGSFWPRWERAACGASDGFTEASNFESIVGSPLQGDRGWLGKAIPT
jgi:hypothetical protein